MIIDNLASYEPDMAELIDTEVETLADRYRVSLKVAQMIINDRDSEGTKRDALILGQVIGLLMASKNMPVMVHALAIAAGLDQLNGAKSEKQIADELGVTRSLLSHYVVGWRDLLSGNTYQFDITKMRKNNDTRATYAKSATSPMLALKKQIRERINANHITNSGKGSNNPTRNH
jgi:predicted transcriptional regulator